jgi:hypothetical protein
MKMIILFSIIFSLIFLSSSNSYSDPLNGTYTVGNGGDYPTINSAIDDAYLQGIDGSVVFDIIPGIYNDSIVISGEFPGRYPGINYSILTIQPQSSFLSSGYVMVTGGISISGSRNIIIKDLSFDTDIDVIGDNISYINNDFNGHSFTAHRYPFALYQGEHYYKLINNSNLYDVSFLGFIRIITVESNKISGKLLFFNCQNVTIEKNIIENGLYSEHANIYYTLSKNNITGNVIFLRGNFNWLFCQFYNNFIKGSVFLDEGKFINNTIINNSADTATLYMESPPLSITNNILINKAGGNVVDFRHWGGNITVIDYNLYYNYGNDSLILYQFNSTRSSFDNVQDFFNETGFDEHSTSQPVSFVSPTDLHLAASSYGDYQLIGTPNNLITDDIDGDLRNPLYPYKGADEIVDFPLPVELAAFTSIVTNNSVNLNWVTTSELNNTGFDIERTTVNTPITNEWLKVGYVQGTGTSSIPNVYEFTDKNLNPGKYNYRLKQIDFNGTFEYYNLSEEVIVGLPAKYSLNQNYPNPFNPVTVISYQISTNDNVLMKIYDINGKEVVTLVNEFKEAGSYEIKFNGSNFASGVYYYQIESGNFKATKKMFLVK